MREKLKRKENEIEKHKKYDNLYELFLKEFKDKKEEGVFLPNNKELILYLCSGRKTTIFDKSGYKRILKYCHKDLINDREVALAAVNILGFNIYYVNAEMQNEKELNMIAVKSCPDIMRDMNKELREDYDIIKAALLGDKKKYSCFNDVMSDDSGVIQYTSDILKDNEELVYLAVKQNGYNIRTLSERFKNRRDLALMAVNNNGAALKYLINEFKNDKYIVLEAIKTTISSLKYASEEIKKEIGDDEPISFLESIIAYEKMEKELKIKENNMLCEKVKI